jgi:hypothetical protein
MDTYSLNTILEGQAIVLPSQPVEDRPMKAKRVHLPHFARVDTPPSIGITNRDRELLQAIFEHNGVLADYQIAKLFFNSMRRMKERMTLLYQNRYVNRFDRRERNSYEYMAYFLDTEGIAYIKQQHGEQARLRLKGERDSRIHHDVMVNDVRLAMRLALPTIGAFVTESLNSLDFDSNHDVIQVPQGTGKAQRRAVVPDDFLHLIMPNGKHRRYFVEVELARKDHPRLLEEKFRPQAHYILESVEFKGRFGERAGGTFLYVAHEEAVLLRMKRTAEKLGEASRLFYFTTFERVNHIDAFFTQPIWWQGTLEEQVPLITPS